MCNGEKKSECVMTEETFHNHICQYLQDTFEYRVLTAAEMTDKDYYFVENHLFEFIEATQEETWKELQTNYYGSDTGLQIIKAIKAEVIYKPLWCIMRDGIEIKGKRIYLYSPKPRSNHSPQQQAAYCANIFSFKKEFYFSSDDKEAIDMVLYLNGLPIMTVELKHQGLSGQASTYQDAINQYVERRHSISKLFTLPFAHFAADTDGGYESMQRR